MAADGLFTSLSLGGSDDNTKILLLIGITLIVIVISMEMKLIGRVVRTWFSRFHLHYVILPQRSVSEPLHNTDRTNTAIVVSHLFIHPVKSLQPVECQSVQLGDRGFVGDRDYMLVTPAPTPLLGYFGPHDATHRFLTQRQCPSLATVSATLHTNHHNNGGHPMLTLTRCSQSKESMDRVTVSAIPDPTNPVYRATVWGDICKVQDLGNEAALFLQRSVDNDEEMPEESKKGVRLVRQCPDDLRCADDQYIPPVARSWLGQAPTVALSDGFPVLLTNEASLEELNRRLREKGKSPIPMSNFRPNLVIRGAKPFEEDTWKTIRIGKVLFHLVKGCARCKESCTNQSTGQVSTEPLETMTEFRIMTGNKENIYFAQNVVIAPSSVGQSISVGDQVEIIRHGDPVWDK